MKPFTTIDIGDNSPYEGLILRDLPDYVNDEALQFSENSKQVLSRRYVRRSPTINAPLETTAGMLFRVAVTVASRGGKTKPSEIEAYTEYFYRLLADRRFFPNSPTFTGAGTRLGQLAACFVLAIEDDMGKSSEGIFSTLRNAALIQQTGGGNGFSFSRLRPAGDIVTSSGGKATGPVGFLRAYDAAFGIVQQGGARRGANMAVLRCDHPDIEEFITCKTEEGEIANFNISVAITDEFMQAVQKDDIFHLRNPRDGAIWRTVLARELFDKIVTCAHRNGEPGMLFIDAANRSNPVPHLYELEATNPCWTGDTMVWTIDGPKTFQELAARGENVAVLTQTDEGKLVYRWMRRPHRTRRDVEVIKVKLDDGTVLRCTPEHKIYLRDGRKVEARELRAGDSVASVYRYRANSKGYLRLDNGVDKPLEHHVVAEWAHGRKPNYPKEHVHHIDGNKQNNIPSNIEIIDGSVHNRMHMVGASNPMSGVWDERNPLFGRSVKGQDNPRYRDDIGDDQIRQMSEQGLSAVKIASLLGCSQYTVNKRLGYKRPQREVVNHKVIAVEFTGEIADVYNGMVDETHRYFVMDDSGSAAILSANCGEQWLGPYENCCLGSINLSVMFDASGQFSWPDLLNVVVGATQFLDSVIDANRYVSAVPQLEEAALRARRIGLGVMGLADVMARLGIRYGSEQGQEFAAQVMEFVRYYAMSTSIDLAARYGPFPAFEGSIYDDKQPGGMRWRPPVALEPYRHNFGRPVLDWSAIKQGIQQHGIRNAAQTTVAPTGTIATVCGCEGYGCEPIFALGYVRHFKDGDKDVGLTYTSPLFMRAVMNAGLDDVQVAEALAHVALHGSCQDLAYLPKALRDAFVVSSDITAEEHVRMQAAMQAFVDNSISKTCNFPEGATKEDVAKAYQLAWELGCKGLTVYVTGSRQQVVLETKATQQKKSEAPAEDQIVSIDKVRRPHRLDGVTYRKDTPIGTVYLTVNSDDNGQPLEVFMNVGKAGSEVAAISEAMGRLISLNLRSPSPASQRDRLTWIVDEMKDIGGGRPLGFGPKRVRSLPDGVAQILAEHLGAESNESEPVSNAPVGDICPECGEPSFLNIEGCRKCRDCGYSVC